MNREFDLGRDLDEMAMSMRRSSIKEDILRIVERVLRLNGRQRAGFVGEIPQTEEKLDSDVA
jgi:hypothetical protein